MSVTHKGARRALAAAGPLALWLGALAFAAAGGRAGALVLALSAVPATAIVILDHGGRTTVAVVAVLTAAAWGSASSVVAQRWPWDKLEHLLLALCFCRWLGDRPETVNARWRMVAAAAVGVTMACAVAWEIVEWLTDRVAGTHMSPSAADTLTDLLAGLVGALAGSVRSRPSHRPTADAVTSPQKG